MSPLWKWFLPGYLLALPHTLIGLLLIVFYRPQSWHWSDGCLEIIAGKTADGETRIWGKPWAQTHGWLIYYESAIGRDFVPIRIHERVHVVQGFVGGPLYVLAYVAMHVWGWLRTFDFWQAYEANPFEEQAYRIGERGTGWGES